MAQILQGLSYALPHYQNFLAYGLSILVFEIPVIVHQQFVAMLRGHMRFLYRLKQNPFAVVQDNVRKYDCADYHSQRLYEKIH